MTYDPQANGAGCYNLAISEIRKEVERFLTEGRSCSFIGGTCRERGCFEGCKNIGRQTWNILLTRQ